MGQADYLKLGDFNALCDVCGFKYKGSQLKARWDGLMVCPDDWEMRHSQDFIKGRKEQQSIPFARPDTEAFITVDYISSSTGNQERTAPTGSFNPGGRTPI